MTYDRYKIEKFDYKEIDKIVGLYTISFNRVEDINFFKWKYLNNPNGEALCMVVKHDGDIVGSCVMIPEEFYFFGEKITLYKCCDLMIHPQHRKQGLSTKLIFSLSDYLMQSGHLLYTLCGKNATPSFIKNRWVKLADVDNYFKHRRLLGIKFGINKIVKLYNRGILRQINSISELCKNYKFKIDTAKIHIAKDEKYFKWRLNNPHYKYGIIGHYENEILNGYIIYSVGLNSIVYIVDLESYNCNSAIIKSLLSSVELISYRSNYKLIIALIIKDTFFQRIFKENRYLTNPFHKGPLRSTIDFNIFINEKRQLNKSTWDIYSLNYDDI